MIVGRISQDDIPTEPAIRWFDAVEAAARREAPAAFGVSTFGQARGRAAEAEWRNAPDAASRLRTSEPAASVGRTIAAAAAVVCIAALLAIAGGAAKGLL